MKVAAVQMRSGIDVEANIATLRELARAAAAEGAIYVQTPEMTGLVQQKRGALFETVQSQEADLTFQTASALASELNIWLHIGSTPIKRDDGQIANRAALFDPEGHMAFWYDKIHMFDVELANGESWRESAIYTPGERLVVADMGGAKLGFSICYDVRFPKLYRDLALAGAQIIAVPAAFTRQTGQAHWHTLLRARAIETGSFIIAAAQGGEHEDGRETYGHSLIIDPWGKVLAEKADDEPGVISCEIDLDQVAGARTQIQNLKHARSYQMAESQ